MTMGHRFYDAKTFILTTFVVTTLAINRRFTIRR